MTTVKVIGAGLAGSEAAWQLANRGIEVELYESLGCEAVIHMDPIEMKDVQVLKAKSHVEQVLDAIDKSVSIIENSGVNTDGK